MNDWREGSKQSDSLLKTEMTLFGRSTRKDAVVVFRNYVQGHAYCVERSLGRPMCVS